MFGQLWDWHYKNDRFEVLEDAILSTNSNKKKLFYSFRYFEDDYGDNIEPSEDFDKRTNSFAHALRVRRGYGDNR